MDRDWWSIDDLGGGSLMLGESSGCGDLRVGIRVVKTT